MTEWPVELRGVTETLVATHGPEGVWNVAALGLHAGDPVTSLTWGDTRTRRNFEREGGGVVQFVRDPVLFTEAALGIVERDHPIVPEADAWAEVSVSATDDGRDAGTEWVEWAHTVRESGIERETVPTTNRGYYAVIEATVAASRLDVPAYDTDVLLDRLSYFSEVAKTCGSPDEREALSRLTDLVDHPTVDATLDPDDGDSG